MLRILSLLLVLAAQSFSARRDLLLENLAFRQQLTVLKRGHPQPRFAPLTGCLGDIAAVLVRIETGVDSRPAGKPWCDGTVPDSRCTGVGSRGIKFAPAERVSAWNSAGSSSAWWPRTQPGGSPRIHGELKMLGIDISERTVVRWMRRAPKNSKPTKSWAVFLNNHPEFLAAMDFFTVPTLTFGVLYCFFVIAHDRRRILHCNVTKHPDSAWIIQQLREAFPYDLAPGYMIFDRAANFNGEVIDTVKSFGIQPKRTSFRSPWQNGVAERWVGNCRREVFDHVIVLNQGHLKRLMMEYIRYYQEDRTHLALDKRTPMGRVPAKHGGVDF